MASIWERTKVNRSLKTLVAVAANRSGFLNAYASVRRKLTKSQVAILMYHRVCPKNDNWSLEPLSPQSFEWQMEYFCRSYEILPLEKLAQYIQERKPLPEKAVVISFDDGYKDNYLYAYPILRKYRVPATIFLTTGHIGGTDRLFWWDKVSYIIHNATVKQVDLDELGSYSLQSELDKFHAGSIITERLKKLPDEEKNLLIEKLLSISGVDISADLGKKLILSWEEVREMSNNGISFGAHTVSHPILTNLPLQEAKWEIVESRKHIQVKLGQRVTSFAYPNGDFNDEIAKFAKECGFTCAVTGTPKLISRGAALYKLSRIGMSNDFNKSKVMFSGVYHDLKLSQFLK